MINNEPVYPFEEEEKRDEAMKAYWYEFDKAFFPRELPEEVMQTLQDTNNVKYTDKEDFYPTLQNT